MKVDGDKLEGLFGKAQTPTPDQKPDAMVIHMSKVMGLADPVTCLHKSPMRVTPRSGSPVNRCIACGFSWFNADGT